MKPKVSVIVPVYNVEKYLSKCLDSLVHQTLQDMEILVINDGSPDNAQAIIEEYEKNYPQLKGYLKKNGGLSDARNYGMRYAQGDYIGFIDSDDCVELDMFEKMYQIAVREGCDLVVSDLVYTYEDGQPDSLMKGLSLLNENRNKAGFLSPLFAWNKLYKRELLEENGLAYPVGLWYEDIPVSIPCFALAKKIGYVEKAMVHYLQRSSSIMGTRNSKKLRDIFTELESTYSYLESHGLLHTYKTELEYLYAEHLMVYGAFRFLRTEEYRSLSREAFQLISKRFPNWRRNPYLKQKFSWKNRLFCMTFRPSTLTLWKAVLERRDESK